MARPLPRPRSIDQLKKSILNPSTTSNYICQFAAPSLGVESSIAVDFKESAVSTLGAEFNSSENRDLLAVSCSEATLPGSTLATYDIDNAYHGVSEKMAYRRIYDDRSDFTFIVDRDYYIIRFFEHWISYIVGETSNSLPNGQNYSYKVKYPKNYRSDNLYITKFEKDYLNNNTRLTYKFIGAYPLSIVSMPVSYDQSQLLKCTVSFTYLRYIVNPVRDGGDDTLIGDGFDPNQGLA